MANSKNTKRALFSSVLSILLCTAMLVGSTFAWFTDSVTSGMNKIVAGNLDIKLQYTTDGAAWNDVGADTNLFKEGAVWEPGHMETCYLKVENLGSLALKYQLSMMAEDTVTSTSVTDTELRLSEHLKYAVIEMTATDGSITPYTRETAKAALETANVKTLKEAYTENGVMYPAAKNSAENPAEKYLALIVYMPETVGNDANYKTGEPAPEIALGINVAATQTPYEEDSFGNEYDEFTVVSTPADFKTAAANDPVILLAQDINLSEDVSFPKDTVVDLNGQTLTVNGSLKAAAETTLTVQGNGTVNGVLYADKTNTNGSTLIINAGENFTVNSSSDMGYAVYGGLGTNIVINGGTYNVSPTVKATNGTITALGASLVVNDAVVNVGPDSVMNAYGIYSNAADNRLTNVTVNAKYSIAADFKNASGKAVIQGGAFVTNQEIGDGMTVNPTIRYQGTLEIHDAAITRIGTGIQYSKTWPKPTEVEGLTESGCTFTPVGENNTYKDIDFKP